MHDYFGVSGGHCLAMLGERWQQTQCNARQHEECHQIKNAGGATTGDPIKNPSHYCVGGFECWDVIEALGLNFRMGSAFSYLWRCSRKGTPEDAIKDIRKAI